MKDVEIIKARNVLSPEQGQIWQSACVLLLIVE